MNRDHHKVAKVAIINDLVLSSVTLSPYFPGGWDDRRWNATHHVWCCWGSLHGIIYRENALLLPCASDQLSQVKMFFMYQAMPVAFILVFNQIWPVYGKYFLPGVFSKNLAITVLVVTEITGSVPEPLPPTPNGRVTNPLSNYNHYNDVIMGAMASQITSLTIVYSVVYSGTDQRKHQSSTSLAFVRESPAQNTGAWKKKSRLYVYKYHSHFLCMRPFPLPGYTTRCSGGDTKDVFW